MTFAERRERILDAWAAGEKTSVLAAQHGISPDHVRMIVSRARSAGDPRAHRRASLVGRPVSVNRCIVAEMTARGEPTGRIAQALGLSKAAVAYHRRAMR